MKVSETAIPDVKIVNPVVFGDARGFFFESFSERKLASHGIHGPWVQDNHSRSARGVLRGLHYQIRQTQGKLVRVVRGEIFDVAVDIRKGSPTFGKWVATTLSEENKEMLWVPQGFAHGFLTVSEVAEVLYKATDYYAPEHERSIIWNDPQIGIEWPLNGLTPALSAKDAAGVLLAQAEPLPL